MAYMAHLLLSCNASFKCTCSASHNWAKTSCMQCSPKYWLFSCWNALLWSCCPISSPCQPGSGSGKKSRVNRLSWIRSHSNAFMSYM